MGKASEMDSKIPPLTPEEAERHYGPRPELRLADAALRESIDANASVRAALEQAAGSATAGPVVIRDSETQQTAVVISAEQYLDLVTSSIRDRQQYEATHDAGVRPSAETLARLGIEQVDPHATWL